MEIFVEVVCSNFSRKLYSCCATLRCDYVFYLDELYSCLVTLHCDYVIYLDELNSRILVPELSPRQLEIIHQDLCVLYQMYCEPSAIDHIQLDDDVIDQLKQSNKLLSMNHIHYETCIWMLASLNNLNWYKTLVAYLIMTGFKIYAQVT